MSSVPSSNSTSSTPVVEGISLMRGGKTLGHPRGFGRALKGFGEDSEEWGFALCWMLSGSRADSVIGPL